MIGLCLGGQLISKALGGTVRANAVREVGWHGVSPTDNAHARDWFGPPKTPLMSFQWHSETFTIPAGAEYILRSDHCQNQGFVVRNTIGLQAHFEVTPEVIRGWLRDSPEDLTAVSDSVHSVQSILVNLDNELARMRVTANRIFSRWFSLLA